MRPRGPEPEVWAGRFRSGLLAVAGPLVIAIGVVWVLSDFALGGKISTAHSDTTTFFVPKYCFLGSSLKSGTIPGWDPHAMLGAPFASDPLSGWMQATPMLLYGLLSCASATRWLVVINPLLAGLGAYWFLRTEGTSRVSATTAGLALSMGTAAGVMITALHFAGIVAWTSLLLAATARCLTARSWAGRIAGIIATALAWGQLAATSLSAGLLIGTSAVLFYGAFRLITSVQESRMTARAALLFAACLLVSLPAVNLAYFVPRAAYLPHTTLGSGYTGVAELQAEFAQKTPRQGSRAGRTLAAKWPVKLALPRGVYLGSAPLLLAFAWVWSRRRRRLGIALAAYGGLMYVLSLEPVAEAIARLVGGISIVDVYLHRPVYVGYGTVIAIALLSGIGLEAWLKTTSTKTRLLMLTPGMLIWGGLVVALNQTPSAALTLVGAFATLAVLVATARVGALSVALPLILAVQLGINAMMGPSNRSRELDRSIGRGHHMGALGRPEIDASHFFEPTGMERTIRRDPSRLMRFGLKKWAEADLRPFPLGIEEVSGYNSLQKLRYWVFVRALSGERVSIYNKSFFEDPPDFIDKLLDVGWLVTDSKRATPGPDWRYVMSTPRRWLYQNRRPTERASIVTSWRVIEDPDGALRAVSDGDVRTSKSIVLEEDPGIEPASRSDVEAGASFRWTTSQEARVETTAESSAMLLVRNTFDRHWEAVLDGRPVPLLRANYFLQAVALPPGTHTVVLRYRDPWIGRGMLGSCAALAILVGAAALSRRRERPSVRPTRARRDHGADRSDRSARAEYSPGT